MIGRRSRQNGVDPAQRTESSDAIVESSSLSLSAVDPIHDDARIEHGLTVEAPGTRASSEQVAITRAELVNRFEISAIQRHPTTTSHSLQGRISQFSGERAETDKHTREPATLVSARTSE